MSDPFMESVAQMRRERKKMFRKLKWPQALTKAAQRWHNPIKRMGITHKPLAVCKPSSEIGRKPTRDECFPTRQVVTAGLKLGRM